MKNGSKVGVLPDKMVMSLTDNELQLAHSLAHVLMQVGIPAAVDYNGSGVKYDGKDNAIERCLSITWLTCKGEAVITSSRSANEYTQPQVQVLANGIVEGYQQHMAAQFPKADNVVPITQGAANERAKD